MTKHFSHQTHGWDDLDHKMSINNGYALKSSYSLSEMTRSSINIRNDEAQSYHIKWYNKTLLNKMKA